MLAIDAITRANALAHQFTLGLIEDMRDAPLTSPTPKGGNHPLWVVGHLALGEGLIQQVVRGVPNPLAEWEPLFAGGTEPTTDPTDYPSFDEIVTAYTDLHEQNMRLLAEIGQDGLSRRIESPPAGFEDVFDTVGNVFLLNALHIMNHRGQVADARRAAGRSPLLEPQAQADS